MYEFIESVILSAAEIMLGAHKVESKTSEKSGDANFVTEYDVAVEKYLSDEISKKIPEIVVIGEESDENRTGKIASSLSLIIDPIDGTTNFIHDYKHSSISVGICDCGKAVYGAVYDPYTDSLYTAERGGGAYLSHPKTSEKREKISVSTRPLSKSLVGFGTSPYYKNELSEKTFEAARRIFLLARDVRRSGSAAIDLCAVACGRLDVFYEYILSPWDYAASSLVIEEAGGIITRFDGSPVTFDKPCSVVAGNKISHSELLQEKIL